MDIMKNGADVIIELRDALTNQIVEANGAHVQVNGCLPFLVKEKRFFVFRRITTNICRVSVHTDGYEERSCTVDNGLLNKIAAAGEGSGICIPGGCLYGESGVCLISLFLYPGTDYPLPAGFVRQELSAEPGEEVRCVKDPAQAMFLEADYVGGLSMYLEPFTELAGQRLRIWGAEGTWEDFAVIGRTGGKELLLEKALDAPYKKGSRISLLYCAVADENGKAPVIVRTE